MKLTPKAHRFVVEAIRDLPDAADRDRLIVNMARFQPGIELPRHVAALAVSALEHYEAWLRQCLTTPDLDEDRRADIINDIGFAKAVAADLRKAGQPVEVA